MKRASYREAVQVIGDNDEAGLTEFSDIVGMASVLVVASIFDVTQERVARDVATYRRKQAEAAAWGERTARQLAAAGKVGP